ncbi:unnamed protein product, partial [Scytosiphon promiscuus]
TRKNKKRTPTALAGLDRQGGSTRQIHPSGRKEMLPVIGGALAVAAVATGLRYLIRAGKRMKEMEEQEKKGPAKNAGSVPCGPGDDGTPADGPAFGLDVGVTNLRLAYADSMEMRPEVVENREGSRWTPACVAFKGGGDPIIGSIARAQRFESASTTMLGVQPLLGLPFLDPASQAIAASASAGALSGGILTAQESLALMLANMKGLGEHKVKAGGAAVLSCPAYFSDTQRDAMAAAGGDAGLIAAVMAAEEMSILPSGNGGGLVGVLDVGGRSAQCSIIDTAGTAEGDRPKMVASDWTAETGGDQWDVGIVDLLDEEFQKANGGLSLKGDAMALTRLFDAATAARVELTRAQQSHVNIPYITADQTGPKHLDVMLTRARVDRIIEPLLRKAEAPCESALKLAQIDASALKSVLVIGGCSRTPALQDLAARIFGKAGGGGGAGVISSPEQSDEMVVLGASLEARHLIYGD